MMGAAVNCRLEQIHARIQVHEVIAEIRAEAIMPITSQVGLQTVKGGAHGKMIYDPIFETAVELEHRSCIIAN